MFRWIKKILGLHIKDVEEFEVATQVAPQHFHVEKHNVSKVELPDFTKWDKLDIDIWARDTHSIKLDRRKSKDNMIEELKNKLENKES